MNQWRMAVALCVLLSTKAVPQTPQYDSIASSQSGTAFGNAISGDAATVACAEEDGLGNGQVAIYRREHTGGYVLDGVLEAGDHSSPLDRFGAAVSMHGPVVAVGAPGDSPASGRVHVFTRQDAWPLFTASGMQGTPASMAVLWSVGKTGQQGDLFGTSVELRGRSLFVGAPGYQDHGVTRGAAYLFGQSTAITLSAGPAPAPWLLLHEFRGEDNLTDGFGTSVAMDGDVVVVGAPGSRVVYAFFQIGANWIPTRIDGLPLLGNPAAEFGYSVALRGNTLVIGAPDHSGGQSDGSVAHVFRRLDSQNGNSLESRFVPVAMLLPSAASPPAGSQFGHAVAIDEAEDEIVVGAPGSSAVYRFRKSAGHYSWIEQARLTAPGPGRLGVSVAVSHNAVLAGDAWPENYSSVNLPGTVNVWSLPDYAFDNPWSSFAAGQHLDLSDDQVVADLEHADFDGDGWVDLIVARRARAGDGKYTPVLLMNRCGRFVDQTAAFASSSTDPALHGFLTANSIHDVTAADFTGDGWPDVLLTPGLADQNEPAVMRSPQLYVNRGLDDNGNWLGLEHDTAVLPPLDGVLKLLFCSSAGGDVNNDGRRDIYHTGSIDAVAGDADKLHIASTTAAGDPVFLEETDSRLTAVQLSAVHGTRCDIRDMNGDGLLDIIKCNFAPLGSVEWCISIAVNNPCAKGLAAGFFKSTGEEAFLVILSADKNAGDRPLDFQITDLDSDGRLDILCVDEGADHIFLNISEPPCATSGSTGWEPKFFVTTAARYLVGDDQGYGGRTTAADLDGDGRPDFIVAGTHPMHPGGAERRAVLLHNRTEPGGEVVLVEERQDATTGWIGARGLHADDLVGIDDSAAFDIDADGDIDLILSGRNGLRVYLNTRIHNAENLGNGDATGVPCLAVTTAAVGQTILTLPHHPMGTANPLQHGTAVVFVVGTGKGEPAKQVPGASGLLVPSPQWVLELTTPIQTPIGGVPSIGTLYLQAIAAPAAGQILLSNAVALELGG